MYRRVKDSENPELSEPFDSVRQYRAVGAGRSPHLGYKLQLSLRSKGRPTSRKSSSGSKTQSLNLEVLKGLQVLSTSNFLMITPICDIWAFAALEELFEL
jgi:hypothetical protein